ncbi:MAG: hypothetical protein ABH861_03400 [Patescibacteria group bacterium]|nr:hypothetical protein [Patescibacteria group bacterium]
MINASDLLYFISALAILFVAGFLCWTLYELASLLHRANEIVDEAAKKLSALERALLSMKSKLEYSTKALGLIIEGGKAALSAFTGRRAKSSSKKK